LDYPHVVTHVVNIDDFNGSQARARAALSRLGGSPAAATSDAK
jgi:hypothetical protein